jgi:Flp pilus assembly protein TadG
MNKVKQNFHLVDPWSAKKTLESQNGTALVEFAVIALLLFSLLFAIIEFGIYLYNRQVITNASREGARAGIVSKYPVRVTEDHIRQEVNRYCQNNLITFGHANDPLTETNAKEKADFGDELKVVVTFKYGFLFLPVPSEMIAETVMRYE